MKQKIIIRMTSGIRAKPMSVAVGYPGVISIMESNDQFDEIIIVGEDINTSDLMKKLCKKVGDNVELVSVTPEGFILAPPPISLPKQVKNTDIGIDKTTNSLLLDILELLKQMGKAHEGPAGGYLMEENEKLKVRVAELEKYSELRTRVERLEKLFQDVAIEDVTATTENDLVTMADSSIESRRFGSNQI